MIRNSQPGDHFAIATIYHRAIHEIAVGAYTPEQCHAWAGEKPDPQRWKARCELKRPFVFIAHGEIAGFLELDTDGHIDCAYINPDYQRQGIMSRLVRHAISICFSFGLKRVYTEASHCARPMFEKLGFGVVLENRVTIRGVELQNYKMELRNET